MYVYIYICMIVLYITLVWKKKGYIKGKSKKKKKDSEVTQTKTFYLIADQFFKNPKKIFSNTKLILYLVEKVNRDPLLTKEWKIKTH